MYKKDTVLLTRLLHLTLHSLSHTTCHCNVVNFEPHLQIIILNYTLSKSKKILTTILQELGSDGKSYFSRIVISLHQTKLICKRHFSKVFNWWKIASQGCVGFCRAATHARRDPLRPTGFELCLLIVIGFQALCEFLFDFFSGLLAI